MTQHLCDSCQTIVPARDMCHLTLRHPQTIDVAKDLCKGCYDGLLAWIDERPAEHHDVFKGPGSPTGSPESDAVKS